MVIANWKAQPATLTEARDLAAAYAHITVPRGVRLLVCPPTIFLNEVRTHASAYVLGAQDVAPYVSGAHTGSTTASMLHSAGVVWVLLGHSERRTDGDTAVLIAAKLARAYTDGLRVVLCVGEPGDVRQQGIAAAQDFVRLQLIRAFGEYASSYHADRLVVAYEPVWAIGTGRTDDPQQAAAMATFIMQTCRELGVVDQVAVLYGGSVTPTTVGAFLERTELAGVLVGGASLSPESIQAIVNSAAPRE